MATPPIEQLQASLATWEAAHAACTDKLGVLEGLLARETGSDAEMLQSIVDRERDVCAQLRSRIAVSAHALDEARRGRGGAVLEED